jgi:tetraacyldisaccharide 4'-kinase
MNQQEYKKIISGQSKGLAAGLLRLLLSIASFFYASAIAIRNFFYDSGIFKKHKVNAVVISVGNITTGGTGKTPLVIRLCNFLRQKNISCAVLTRGYKTQKQATGHESLHRTPNGGATSHKPRATIDEPAVIAQSCPDAVVIVNPDRIAGAKEAIEKHNAKVLILDDGFQHRRLFRNLDIVAIDAAEPFGFGRLLPAGLLREPTNSLKRADAVVITRSDLVGESELNSLEQRLLEINPKLLIVKSVHKPSKIQFSDDKEQSPEYLKGKRIFAFCGIGSPDSFLRTLERCGAVVGGAQIYDDHYHYTEDDVSYLMQKAEQINADIIITTLKDWTKMRHPDAIKTANIPFAYIAIELNITDGEDKLRRLIAEAIAGKI